jgi:hypothetical protein
MLIFLQLMSRNPKLSDLASCSLSFLKFARTYLMKICGHGLQLIIEHILNATY